MKRISQLFLTAGLTALLPLASYSALITVNTIDNTDFSAGKTNLYYAISLANTNGDTANTINFNIPGGGPHYIVTPQFSAPGGIPDLNGGYPIITNSNLTIDGYSQPGASPNTSTILGTNNAVLQIVIDSRQSNYPSTDANHPLKIGANSMNYQLITGKAYGSATTGYPGFGAGDAAQFGIFWASNVVIRGLCFLDDWYPGTSSLNVNSISLGLDWPTNSVVGFVFPQMGLRVSGCWFNLMTDGATVVEGGNNAVSTKWHKNTSGSNPSGKWAPGGTTVGVQKGTSTPRADFNIFMSQGQPLSLHGTTNTVQGNRFNVFPDGMHQYFPDPLSQDTVDYVPTSAFIGGTRDGWQTYGTDGDGVNDAEERNIFAGLPRLRSSNEACIDQQAGAFGIRISGNYFGIAVDGVTRWTNSCTFVRFSDRPTPATNCIVGSDFDGVSDALEANVIANNWPLDFWWPNAYGYTPDQVAPTAGVLVWNAGGPPETVNPDAQVGTISVAFRGNKLINNFAPPVSPFCTSPNRSSNPWYFAYYTNTIVPFPFSGGGGLGDGDEGSTNFTAVLDSSSSVRRLKGTFQLGKAPATNYIVDIYALNVEGETNGLKFTQLTNDLPAGWVQGETCLAANLVADGAADLNPASGAFTLNISKYNIPAGTPVTVTVSYARLGAVGSHNLAMQTDRFSLPVALNAASPITITSVVNNGDGTGTINWTGGDAPYIVEMSTNLLSGIWVPVATTPSTTYTGSISPTATFFRVQ